MSNDMNHASKVPTPEALPTDPRRVRAFANFFKGYMSISSVVTAALAYLITYFKFIPTFAVQTKLLSAYTSLFCFLILAFIFYNRHKLAPLMFYNVFSKTRKIIKLKALIVSILPALLIILSLICLLYYLRQLEYTLMTSADFKIISIETRDLLLEQVIPRPEVGNGLMLAYLGIFVTAEAAFILMAKKEYLQDLLKLPDLEIIAMGDEKRP